MARGLQVWPQVTPRPLTMQFTMENPFSLNVSAVFGALMDGDRASRIAAYRDPEWRPTGCRRPRSGHDAPALGDLRGVRVGALPRARGPAGRTTWPEERGCEPLDVICDIAVAEDLATRFRIYIANDDPDSVSQLLTHDRVVLGLSDAGAHVEPAVRRADPHRSARDLGP